MGSTSVNTLCQSLLKQEGGPDQCLGLTKDVLDRIMSIEGIKMRPKNWIRHQEGTIWER